MLATHVQDVRLRLPERGADRRLSAGTGLGTGGCARGGRRPEVTVGLVSGGRLCLQAAPPCPHWPSSPDHTHLFIQPPHQGHISPVLPTGPLHARPPSEVKNNPSNAVAALHHLGAWSRGVCARCVSGPQLFRGLSLLLLCCWGAPFCPWSPTAREIEMREREHKPVGLGLKPPVGIQRP